MTEKDLKVGDPVKVFNDQIQVIGVITSIDEEGVIRLGYGPFKLYFPSDRKLSIPGRDSRLEFLECSIESTPEYKKSLVELSFRDLMIEEITFFLNNCEYKTDDPRYECNIGGEEYNALNKLSTENLITITKIILPFGMGERGLSDIEELRKEAEEEKRLECFDIILYAT